MAKKRINEEAIKKHLDTRIVNARSCKDGFEPAKFYLDAYQSFRLALFGEALPEESKEKDNKP